MSDVKAAIAKASATARARLDVLDRATAERLSELYRDAADTLTAEIARYADAEGNLRLAVLRDLLQQVNGIMAALRDSSRFLLGNALLRAAEDGAGVWVTGASISLLAETAVRFVENFVAADGLRLSNRLWRLENGALQAVAEILRRNVVLGRDASRAAQEFLARGEAIPLELRAQLGLDGAGRLGQSVAEALTTASGNAYSNALRLFRTELNRAHGEAYQHGAGSNPDVIGMKFNLSPNHPRYDICDFYAKANLHGLGPGVYPIGQVPWPAHPNTMSYLTAVFRDEVSAADRNGRQAPLDWLRGLKEPQQEQVLGAAKARALRAGVLNESDITTPWQSLKDSYERRGYTFG